MIEEITDLLTLMNLSRSMLPELRARWRWYIVSSMALSSAMRLISLVKVSWLKRKTKRSELTDYAQS